MSARDHLLHALGEITSQQPERLKAAEANLRLWEVEPQFYPTIQVCMCVSMWGALYVPLSLPLYLVYRRSCLCIQSITLY